MALLHRTLVVGFGICFFVYLGARGYFDGLFVIVYDKYFEKCNYCHDTGHGLILCPEKAVDGGAFGRWIVPDVGINVACYVPLIDAQTVTDTRDSAALIFRGETTLIADHNYQGFNAIKNCKVGTVAYMFTGNAVKEYVCTDVIQGYNTGSSLTDLKGKPLDIYKTGGYTAYTCNYFKNSITVVQFAPVKS